jgi:hypothetical protein
METARPHEEQKRTFSEDTAPQPEQVIMPGNSIAREGSLENSLRGAGDCKVSNCAQGKNTRGQLKLSHPEQIPCFKN